MDRTALAAYLFVNSAAAAILWTMFGFVFKHRHKPAIMTFLVLIGVISLVPLVTALAMLSNTVEGARFWHQTVRLSIFVLPPPLVLLFVSQYLKLPRWRTLPTLLLMFPIPLLSAIANLTNAAHGLYIRTYDIEQSFSFFIRADWQPGPWFWFAALYAYGLVLITLVELINHARHQRGSFGVQIILFVGAVAAPALMTFLDTFRLVAPGTQPTVPFGLVITGILIMLGIVQYGLFDVYPLSGETIVETMSDPVIVVDEHGRLLGLNPAATRVFGASRREAVGQPLADLDPALASPVSELEGPDGRIYDLRTSQLRTALGTPIGRVLALRDITVQKENAHLRTMEAFKNEVIDTFAHELRTPVTSLKLYHRLMRDAPEHRDRYLSVAEAQTHRIETLLQSLLLIADLDRERQPLTYDDICMRVLADVTIAKRQHIAAEKNLTFRVETSRRLVRADRQLLQHALDAVLINAIQYADPESTVRISQVHKADDDRSYAGVAVTNSGPPIPAEEQPFIFERFYRGSGRSQAPGLGLGLAITQEVIKLHGGHITLLSEGGLTTITLWLPL